MRNIITFVFVTILHGIVFSQDTYSFTCLLTEDKAPAHYQGFLLRLDNGSGFIRLSGSATRGHNNIYDLEWGPYRSGDELMTDYAEQRMHLPFSGDSFVCIRARFIRTVAGQGNSGISSLTVWLKKTSSGKSFEPVSGPIPVAAGEENKPTGFQKLQTRDLGKNYLQSFFTEKELNRKGLLTPTQLISARKTHKPVFYVIAVHSGEILCREDAADVTEYYLALSRFMNLPFRKTILRDNDFNVRTITRTIQTLTPGNNDIVVFAYSGHGFSYMEDEQNKFPQLALWHGVSPKKDFIRVNTINLEEIYNLILAKNARLSIVTGDCCNSYIEMRRQHTEPTRPGVFGPPDKTWNHKTVSELFLETRQSYLIAAARKGEVAASHRWYGGFFTFNFLKAINETLLGRQSGKAGWDEIIQTAGAEASELSQLYPCREAVCGQHLISKTGK